MDIYPDLETSPYKDDIVQSSYEILVRAIDSYDSNLGNQNFRWYLQSYAYKHILRKTSNIYNNGYNQDLRNIISIREEEYNKGNISTNQTLSSLSGLTQTRIEELLTLEQMINAESIEGIQETECKQLKSTFDLEETLNRKTLQEKLVKIIETLSNEQQKEVIKLYCGLGNQDSYKIIEIAKMLDLSRQRANQHRDNAIELLSDPARLKYIKELYNGYSELQLHEQEELTIDETDLTYERLELALFKIIYTKDELKNMIECLDIKYHDVLLTYFELDGSENDSFKDKLNKLKIGAATYIKRRREGLSKLRKLFNEQYVIDNPNEDVNTTLDYLMYNYLNKPKTKTRKKDGAN